jgi:hypothetical protein
MAGNPAATANAVDKVLKALLPEQFRSDQAAAQKQGFDDFSNMVPVGGNPSQLLSSKTPFPADLARIGFSEEDVDGLYSLVATHDSVIKANYWAGVAVGASLATATTALPAAEDIQAALSATEAKAAGTITDIRFPSDYASKNTRNLSAVYKSEGEARALARTKIGSDPVEVGPGKLRSQDGRWQYRARPTDLTGHGPMDSPHIHLEHLNPKTGEVLENWHLRWEESPHGR